VARRLGTENHIGFAVTIWQRLRCSARGGRRTLDRGRTPAYASIDTRLTSGWPAYEEALKANHITYTGYVYEGAQHGFHNDTTPRFSA
jgi:hypothetical protein